MNIPLSSPDIEQAEIDAVVGVLRSGRLSLGEKLPEFEAAFASYVGAAHAVGMSSGTAALHLAVRALGIGEGDEVIVPSFAFVAAANAIRYERAAPVFVDIDPHSLNLDPALIEGAITSRTRAILVVHTFGVPAAMSEILQIARRRGLLVIEDACEALGAEVGGQKAGTLGDVGVFGFYPNKQITTAEGGMAVTGRAGIAKQMRSLRNHGRVAGAGPAEFGEVGYNYRLSELHCALGIEQLRRVETILKKREATALGYRERLARLACLELPMREIVSGRISWFVYVVRLCEGATAERREEIIRGLAQRGVQAGRYFPPIHLQAAYRESHRARLTVTESVAERTMALPFFTRITEPQMDAVCQAVRDCL
jgi:perosamine synthetase